MKRSAQGPSPDFPATPSRSGAGSPWSRGLVAGALAVTLVQALVFAWLARIPDPQRVPAEWRQRAGGSVGKRAMLLAVDGLREEQSWLPNPRPLVHPQRTATLQRPIRPAQMELVPPERYRPAQYLSPEAAPTPVPPAIPRPELPASDLTPPRPASPPTQTLALTRPEVVVTGALRARGLRRPVVVAPWKGSDPLGVTRVEVSVNPDGEVVLARVVEGCGVKAADLQFLAACRSARFAPRVGAVGASEFNQLERGQLAVRWAVVP